MPRRPPIQDLLRRNNELLEDYTPPAEGDQPTQRPDNVHRAVQTLLRRTGPANEPVEIAEGVNVFIRDRPGESNLARERGGDLLRRWRNQGATMRGVGATAQGAAEQMRRYHQEAIPGTEPVDVDPVRVQPPGGPAEEAEAVGTLLARGRTYDQISEELGIPRRTVRRRAQLTALRPGLMAHLRQGRMALGVAERLARWGADAQREAMALIPTLPRGRRLRLNDIVHLDPAQRTGHVQNDLDWGRAAANYVVDPTDNVAPLRVAEPLPDDDEYVDNEEEAEIERAARATTYTGPAPAMPDGTVIMEAPGLALRVTPTRTLNVAEHSWESVARLMELASELMPAGTDDQTEALFHELAALADRARGLATTAIPD